MNGKKKSYTTEVSFIRYSNPFTVLKLGSKDYASKLYDAFDGTNGFDVGKGKSGVLSIRMAQGFKLKGIEIENSLTRKRIKTVRNNSKVSVKQNQALVIKYTCPGINGQVFEFPFFHFSE